jgi:hypothetical protein
MNKLNSKKSLYILLILAIFSIFGLSHVSSKLVKKQVEIAINCGGPEYVNPDGVVYKKVWHNI